MDRQADFFEFVSERQSKHTRELIGLGHDDPILNLVRHGTIYREDYDVTQWFREHIRDVVADDPERSVLACVAFRFFNNIPAGSILKPYLLREEPWNEKRILQEMNSVGPMIHGSMPGLPESNKEASALAMIRPFVSASAKLGHDAETHRFPLQLMHQKLVSFEFMWPAVAYEVVTDLRHTCVLDQAIDINLWAYVSRQVTQGMGWVMSDCPGEFLYGHERTEDAILHWMTKLLEASRHMVDDPLLPWEMSEVESALHEFNRYRHFQTL